MAGLRQGLLCLLGISLLLTGGCLAAARANAWKQKDQELRAGIGNTHRDTYIQQMGPPDSESVLSDGKTVLKWERTRVGSMPNYATGGSTVYQSGWRILLTFRPDGLLDSYSWNYW